ncbi:MAG: NAD(P)H-dependent amine dehydrogenase family protein [Acidimicrobiales bacterium]
MADVAYKVIQWATGTVGVHAVPAIAAHPDLELAGLWVHSDAKVGRDAGEICGVGSLGVAATNDVDALLSSDADCVCYMAHSDIRPDEVVEDLARMLAAGKNVVNTSFVPLLYPKAAGPGVQERLEAACLAGEASLYTSGIDPGFGNAGAAIGALALCKEVASVRMAEIVNYATWDNPFTMFEIMGFGKASAAESLLLSPGSTALAWGPVIELVAAALDVTLDGITEWHEVLLADKAFDIASGRIPAGTISGMRFEIRGMVGGQPRIVVEHVTRLRDGDAPEWRQGEGYVIDIDGEPSLRLSLQLSSRIGDHNYAGCLATAMHVINAIPAVCEARPGVLSFLDLPVYSARHLMRP